MKKTFLGEVSFWLHTPLFALVLLPFFIPQSLWPDIVTYHFWYVIFLYTVGYGTGLIYYSRAHMLLFMCPLTLLTQRLRGYSWVAPETYGGSFIGELWERMGFKKIENNRSNFNTGSLIMHAMLVLVSIQYLFGYLIW